MVVPLNYDIFCVAAAQRQFIPPQRQLDGIAHGRHLAHHHLGARRQTHIQQTIAQCALAAHRDNARASANFQLIERHGFRAVKMFMVCMTFM
jgi:hypothetical protein